MILLNIVSPTLGIEGEKMDPQPEHKMHASPEPHSSLHATWRQVHRDGLPLGRC